MIKSFLSKIILSLIIVVFGLGGLCSRLVPVKSFPMASTALAMTVASPLEDCDSDNAMKLNLNCCITSSSRDEAIAVIANPLLGVRKVLFTPSLLFDKFSEFVKHTDDFGHIHLLKGEPPSSSDLTGIIVKNE